MARNDVMNNEQTTRHLRYLIVGLLHVGRLKRGDALPSIRAVAKEIGVDHRRVAEAYRALEVEGLVEIRPGAGVFLAHDPGAAEAEPRAESWVAEVLLEGWARGMPRRHVGRIVEGASSAPVRCALVESNEDHMLAISAELEEDFSMEVEPVLVSPSAAGAEIPARVLAGVDLVVTTVFHAAAARAAAGRAGVPLVVLRLNPLFAAEVGRRLARAEVTAVVADPRYSARAGAYLEVTPHRSIVRVITVDELPGSGVDVHGEGVLLTRAARRRLGLPEYHLVPSPPSYLSRGSAREILDLIVRLAARRDEAAG
ncbi:MAG: GntR family transcriptional regulator [Gemmatimonadetes bacterium]|nr:GntR family transcriptional regulator [Gemmatimonadota bacterium]